MLITSAAHWALGTALNYGTELGFVIFLKILIEYRRPDIVDIENRVTPISGQNIPHHFDFIIIGAGSAGSVIANRLTENENFTVLLLEAGGDDSLVADIPSMAGYIQRTEMDWEFQTEPSSTYCLGMNNHQCLWPRGKSLGGTSAINSMLYVRGNRKDYDGWSDLGNPGWSYDEILPYFKKSENMSIPEYQNSAYHGTEGYLSIERLRYVSPLTRYLMKAGRDIGYDTVDINGESQVGFMISQSTIRDGLRCSTEKAFLRSASHRKNLYVSTHSMVEKILVDEATKTAYGVQFRLEDKTYNVHTRAEVILSAGSIGSPQILMLSGIGPKEHLEDIGIPVILDSPGVGQNLQDHIAMGGLIYTIDLPSNSYESTTENSQSSGTFPPSAIEEFLNEEDGLLYNILGDEAVAFVNTKYVESTDYPDIELIFTSAATGSRTKFFNTQYLGLRTEFFDSLFENIIQNDSYRLSVELMRPRSRGYIKLKDANPYHHPIIVPNYFDDPHDLDVITLLLTDPPTFSVTNLLINETTTQLAIWGNCGIAVLKLPKRWGKHAAFQGGKETISCRSHSLDERLFHCSESTEVRRARWHPGSTKDCHLLVLTSENTFHLYECELTGAQSLTKIWSVGPASGSPSKMPTLASLGETAVDFDFVTPTLKPDIDIKDIEIEKVNWNDIEWPILVLMGDGNVCTVHGNILISKVEKPTVTGPLSIYPRADDNYGVDSCSIMCLQTTPPLVVIAATNGKLYHSILLRENSEDDEKKTWSQYGSTYSLHTPEDALFVFECVEMELGLSIREDEKKYSCPVHLHVDRGNSSRYFCSHNAGIHVVNLPMVSQLEEYILSKDEDADLFLPTLSNQSSSQYLVCTRTKSTQEPAPILGLGLLQDPCILVALLHTGVAISLSVVDLHYLVKIELLEPVISPSKKMAKEPFDAFIKNLLKHDVSQPILKLGPNVESSPQEVLELLLRAIHVFRSEHFPRQDKVQAEIAKRTRTLRALKTHQLKELELLAESRKELQEAAERLAERYEDIKDKQTEYVRRTKEILQLIKQRQPSMSMIEKEEANELKKMDNRKNELSQLLEKLKNKMIYQNIQLVNWDKNEAKKDVVISKQQKETIETHLTQMSVEITDMVSTVKTLQEEIS